MACELGTMTQAGRRSFGGVFVVALALLCLGAVTSTANAEITLVEPVDDSTLNSTTVTFAWESTGISVFYRISVSPQESPWVREYEFTYTDDVPLEPAGTRLESTQVLAEGLWYWMLEGFALDGSLQDQSAARRFTIDTILTLNVQSTPVTGVSITGTPSGTTNYSEELDYNSSVGLTAPATFADGGIDYVFVRWTLNGVNQPDDETALGFDITEDTTAVAVYALFDTDEDGLADSVETNTGIYVDETDTGTDPNDPDTDDDGLNDGAEVNTHGTDPADADSDDDGLNDGEEIFRGLDPLDPDTDDDHLNDGAEINLGTGPRDPDSDDDGLLDGEEVIRGLNPLDPDTDADGLPDAWEVANGLSGTDPAGANGPDGDREPDGLTNLQEYNLGTDPNNADSDNDGLTDGDEVDTYDTDPTDPDTDGDQMVDGDEVRDLDPVRAGTQNPFDPTDPDTTGDSGQDAPDGVSDGANDYDGDGLSNAWELWFGRSPVAWNDYPYAMEDVPAGTTVGWVVLVLLLLATALILTRSARLAQRARASGIE